MACTTLMHAGAGGRPTAGATRRPVVGHSKSSCAKGVKGSYSPAPLRALGVRAALFSGVRGHRSRKFLVAASSDDEPENEGSSVPPSTESLFMQELRRRGASQQVSAPDERGRSSTPSGSSSSGGGGFANTSPRDPFGGVTVGGGQPVGTTQEMEDQLEKSRKLNSEGLEGLIPRATELLKLGGSQFLAFLPFMGVGVVLFVGCYLVLGSSFIHGGSTASAPPPYIDPYLLLDEPTYDPMVPLRPDS